MNFQILAFFLLFLILPNGNTIYAENINSDLGNSSSQIEKYRSTTDSKIHPILIQWQLSENPNEFAKENNLSVDEDKIAVYIYLKSEESRSKFPPEITITGFDEKIVVAFVSSEQMDQLEDLEIVERVMLPDRARTFSIPKIEMSEDQTTPEDQYDYLAWIVIAGITIFIIITIFKKRQKSQD